MSEKKSAKFKCSFDDSKLPNNTISAEEIERIDKIAQEYISEGLEKLRKTNPELFRK